MRWCNQQTYLQILKIGSHKGNKSKNKQVGLHRAKKLMHSKGNHQQNENAAYWTGENICKSYIWWRVSIQSIQITHTTQQHKKNPKNKKTKQTKNPYNPIEK